MESLYECAREATGWSTANKTGLCSKYFAMRGGRRGRGRSGEKRREEGEGLPIIIIKKVICC